MSVTLQGLDPDAHDWVHVLCKSRFLDGECYAFAIALHRGLGWPMVGLMTGKIIRHALVKSPDNHFYDVRGRLREGEIGIPFDLSPPYQIVNIEEADLLAVRPVAASLISMAGKLAQAMWSDLPWIDAYINRVLAFTRDLEELSRKYKIWVRAPYPNGRPHLSEGDGDEAGYELTPTEDGVGILIDRKFK